METINEIHISVLFPVLTCTYAYTMHMHMHTHVQGMPGNAEASQDPPAYLSMSRRTAPAAVRARVRARARTQLCTCACAQVVSWPSHRCHHSAVTERERGGGMVDVSHALSVVSVVSIRAIEMPERWHDLPSSACCGMITLSLWAKVPITCDELPPPPHRSCSS